MKFKDKWDMILLRVVEKRKPSRANRKANLTLVTVDTGTKINLTYLEWERECKNRILKKKNLHHISKL